MWHRSTYCFRNLRGYHKNETTLRPQHTSTKPLNTSLDGFGCFHASTSPWKSMEEIRYLLQVRDKYSFSYVVCRTVLTTYQYCTFTYVMSVSRYNYRSSYLLYVQPLSTLHSFIHSSSRPAHTPQNNSLIEIQNNNATTFLHASCLSTVRIWRIKQEFRYQK